jgi:hypothetical protein
MADKGKRLYVCQRYIVCMLLFLSWLTWLSFIPHHRHHHHRLHTRLVSVLKQLVSELDMLKTNSWEAKQQKALQAKEQRKFQLDKANLLWCASLCIRLCQTSPHTCTHTHTNLPSHLHTHTQHAHTQHSHLHTHTHNTHTHNTHTYTHTHNTHTHTHMHTHTYTHTNVVSLASNMAIQNNTPWGARFFCWDS